MPKDVHTRDEPSGVAVNEIANAGLVALKQAATELGVDAEQVRFVVFVRLDEETGVSPNSTSAASFPESDAAAGESIHELMLREMVEHMTAIAEVGGIPIFVGEMAPPVPRERLL